jgi:hypothetical protein
MLKKGSKIRANLFLIEVYDIFFLGEKVTLSYEHKLTNNLFNKFMILTYEL